MRNAKKLLALVLAFVMVLGIVPVASAQTVHTHGIEEYPEIELGVETVFEIVESGETVYVRYTPEVTAEYTFASSGASSADMIDPEGYLYDSEMNLLATHSNNGPIDFNFTLVYTLEAGKTYVYAANLYGYRAGVEFVVLLTADLPEASSGNPFTDVAAGAWYEAPINWAVENGVTSGLSATEFGINANCNRAHMVTFLYRAFNK